MTGVCATCGQTIPEPVRVEAAVEPPEGFLGMLTDEERQRGVHRLHELDHARQAVVRAALKGSAK